MARDDAPPKKGLWRMALCMAHGRNRGMPLPNAIADIMTVFAVVRQLIPYKTDTCFFFGFGVEQVYIGTGIQGKA